MQGRIAGHSTKKNYWTKYKGPLLDKDIIQKRTAGHNTRGMNTMFFLVNLNSLPFRIVFAPCKKEDIFPWHAYLCPMIDK